MVHYQPQLDLAPSGDRRRRGAGALEPSLSRLGPARRVHRARRGHRADRAADGLGAAQRLPAAARLAGARASPALQMSVNLSPVQFRERGVELLIERVLAESSLDAGSLDLELTENAVIENSQTAIQSLRHLNQPGRQPLDRRFRHRLFLALLHQAPAGPAAEDRPVASFRTSSTTNDEVIVRAIINLGTVSACA